MCAAVMISAGFVHLLGTAIKELDPMNRFPLAPFLCGLGFLVTLVADHLAETLSQRCSAAAALSKGYICNLHMQYVPGKGLWSHTTLSCGLPTCK